MLGGVGWWLVTDISEQPISPFFKVKQVLEEWLLDCLDYDGGTYSFRNVDNYQPSLRNISEDRSSLLLSGGRLKSRKSQNV